MRNCKVVVQNEHGIHARVAMKILDKSKMLDSTITLCNGCVKADGCSMLELLLLGARKGAEIKSVVNGGDEEKNIKLIAELFTEGSGI